LRCHFANGEELLGEHSYRGPTARQPVRRLHHYCTKILANGCYRMGPLDATSIAVSNDSQRLRIAANR
jgi:hypothetical protein